MIGLADGSDMLAGVGEKAVKQMLVFTAECAPEVAEGFLFAEYYLGGRL
jgi:hypothetical protein